MIPERDQAEATILAALREVYAEPGVWIWLGAYNRNLHGVPVDLLNASEYARVIREAHRLSEGEPRMIPDSEPVPVPDRVLLPAPYGVGPSDTGTAQRAWWRVKSTREGELYAEPGQVYYLDAYTSTDLDTIETDALATLAAVRWARGQA